MAEGDGDGTERKNVGYDWSEDEACCRMRRDGVKKRFWSKARDYIFRHHVAPRGQLYVPRESSLSIPLKYIDVNRQTKTNLDNLEGGQH